MAHLDIVMMFTGGCELAKQNFDSYLHLTFSHCI